MKKNVIIIDDHVMLRTGLKTFLEQYSDWQVVGEGGTEKEVFSLLDELEEPPLAAIVDISLPGSDGISVVRKLSSTYPQLLCVMYSMHVTAEYIQSAMRAGALGYVSKSSPSDEVLIALESLYKGDPYLDSYALKIHLGQYAWDSGRRAGQQKEFKKDMYGNPDSVIDEDIVREPLTFQEGRVFALAAKNMNNAEIATALSLKVKTVENYMSLIYQKLHLKNRYELVVYARETGVRF